MTGPAKGHHRWMESALERSSAQQRSSASLPVQPGRREGSSSGANGLHEWRDGAPSGSSKIRAGGAQEPLGSWAEATRATQAFLSESRRHSEAGGRRREELAVLRSSVVNGGVAGAGEAGELKLARAEYEELRAMHLSFVDASNSKLMDLQEAYRLRSMELEALRKEREAEQKEHERLSADLNAYKVALQDKAFELQIAERKLQPFLEAREGLLSVDKKAEVGQREESDKMNGMLRNLCQNVPMLERELKRFEDIRANEQQSIQEKEVVLRADVVKTRHSAVALCSTLRDLSCMTRAMFAFRTVVEFQQQQRYLFTALRLKIDLRLARVAFALFIKQIVMGNLLRRRGYLSSTRHVRLSKTRFFSAWRWAHFAGRWLPVSVSAHAPEDAKENTIAVQLEASTLLTRTGIMAMTEFASAAADSVRHTDGASQMSQNRPSDQRACIAATPKGARAFDPDNLAMARARENFEKAAMIAPKRGSPAPRNGGDTDDTSIYPRLSVLSPSQKVSRSLGLQQGSGQRAAPTKTLDSGDKLDISSDSSLDEVLQEAERESMNWVGRHRQFSPKKNSSAASNSPVKSPSAFAKQAREALESVGWEQVSERVRQEVPARRILNTPQKSSAVPTVSGLGSDKEVVVASGALSVGSAGEPAASFGQPQKSSPPGTQSLRSSSDELPSPEKNSAGAGKHAYHLDTQSLRVKMHSPQSLVESSAPNASPFQPMRIPPTPQTSPTTKSVAESRLEEQLRVFYRKVLSAGASHPDPALVARMYAKDVKGLNQALRSKYGRTLEELAEGGSLAPGQRSRRSPSPDPSIEPVSLGRRPGGAHQTQEMQAQQQESRITARRKKVLRILHDDEDTPVKSHLAESKAILDAEEYMEESGLRERFDFSPGERAAMLQRAAAGDQRGVRGDASTGPKPKKGTPVSKSRAWGGSEDDDVDGYDDDAYTPYRHSRKERVDAEGWKVQADPDFAQQGVLIRSLQKPLKAQETFANPPRKSASPQKAPWSAAALTSDDSSYDGLD